MKISFDETAHTYSVDGVELPSVTTVCRFLSYDQKSDRPWLAKLAADRGTRIHAACVLLDYGETPEDEPDIAGYLTAYRRFLSDYRPEWAGIEYITACPALGLAGTVDRYGWLYGVAAKSAPLTPPDGQSSHRSLAAPSPMRQGPHGDPGCPVILDIKTGARLHDAPLRGQLTGYRRLLANDVHRFHAKRLLALQLRKDGTYTLLDIRQDDELLNACLFLHNATERKRRK